MFENFLKLAMSVQDEAPIGHSRLYGELRWRHRKNVFFSVTERSKEMIWSGVRVVFFTLAVAYFSAHFMLYITNYYQNTPSRSGTSMITSHQYVSRTYRR